LHETHGFRFRVAGNAIRPQLYGERFEVFRRHPTLTSVSTWGISDAHTWLSIFPVRRTNKPLLFDTTSAPKAVFHAIVK
jgi:endo-1,4-beta-xylanase